MDKERNLTLATLAALRVVFYVCCDCAGLVPCMSNPVGKCESNGNARRPMPTLDSARVEKRNTKSWLVWFLPTVVRGRGEVSVLFCCFVGRCSVSRGLQSTTFGFLVWATREKSKRVAGGLPGAEGSIVFVSFIGLWIQNWSDGQQTNHRRAWVFLNHGF